METIVIKRDKRLRNQNVTISLLGLLIFLSISFAVIDLSVFLAVFLGIIGLLYFFSFIQDSRLKKQPTEIIFSDKEVFFNSIGTFAWDDINAFEVKRRINRNEYNEKSTSIYLHILLENRKSFYFSIDLLEKNENEIVALFIKYKPSFLQLH
jgi:hypothetical protein